MSSMAEINDVWKCPKHPSRRHRVGVCATCLRDRLIGLCPNCANSLPCPCFTDSSSTSSFFSRFSIDTNASSISAVGRVVALIDSEPSFRRSRSTAAPSFLSSRFYVDDKNVPHVAMKSWWWSVFGIFKSEVRVEAKTTPLGNEMTRSKSVSGWRASSECGKGLKGSLGNQGWHFPSPMKVFRQMKPRSPLYRG